MQDSNLVLLNQAVTATVQGTFLDIGKGGIMYELDVRTVFPQATGTSPTAGIAFDLSDDGATVVETQTVVPAGTAAVAGVNDTKIRTRHRYVRANLTVGGTTPNLGTVTSLITSGPSFRYANIPNT